MKTSDLTADQLERMFDDVRPAQSYLRRLADRMEQRGFAESDPTYQLVSQAHDAVFALAMHLHRSAVSADRRRVQPHAGLSDRDV